MRTKPSHLPLLSLDRSVQLFPAHLTRLATFAIDAPDLTPSQLMHRFDHGNTHTKDKSQTTDYWWINCSQGPQAQCLSEFHPSLQRICSPILPTSEHVSFDQQIHSSLGKEALIDEFHLERVTYPHVKLRSLLDEIQIRGDPSKSWGKSREGCAGQQAKSNTV